MKIRPLIQLGLTSAVIAAPAAAQSADEVAILRQQLEQLAQRLEQLERQSTQHRTDAVAPVATAAPAVVVSAGAGGFRVESADRGWTLRVRGNVQLDGRVFFDDGGISNNDKFLLRRVRPSVEGKLYDYITYRVMPDFAPGTTTLLEAWANFEFSPVFQIRVGKTKSPAGLERLVSQTNLLFIERGYPTQLLPNRDVGVQFHGSVFERKLDWNLSVLAGTRDGANTAVTDVDDNFELAGRLFAHPWRGNKDHVLERLGIGSSFTYGTQQNQSPSAYTTTGLQRWFSYRSGVTNDGTVFRFSPQGYWYFKSVGLLAEYAASRHDLVMGQQAATLTNYSWQVLANWVVTGEQASYGAVVPAKNFDWKAGNWGALELALRIGELRVDEAAFPVFADPQTQASKVSGYSLGANWYWNRHVKLSLNFDYNSFDGGAAGPVTAQSEKALFSRVQVQF
jgi:phosphate-selective porin OprO and OprP